MRHFNIKGVIGKGGMGAKTLAACQGSARPVPACHRRCGFADRQTVSAYWACISSILACRRPYG